MTLGELVTTLERRAAEAEREGATASVANVYRLVLEELRAIDGIAAASVTTRDTGPQEQVLTPKEVAALLKVPPGYPYRHARELGGLKVGKYLRFPETAVRRRLERSRQGSRT